MTKQIYYDPNNKVEAYISDKAKKTTCKLHQVSKNQIILLPENKIAMGSIEENKQELFQKNIDGEIIYNIIEKARSHVFSVIP